MAVDLGSPDWRGWKLREWLLHLLRFAVTRDLSDQAAVLALADEIDSAGIGLGVTWRPTAPRFFLRTSEEVCEAILAGDADGNAVLRKHATRIDDRRLRSAFEAAVGLQPQPRWQSPRPSSREHLWQGLPRRLLP
jgi:hypothetical protein